MQPAIVCLHMSPKSGKNYQDVLPHLAGDRIAIAPDYPGHGESDPPPPEPQVSITDFADSTWAAVDALCDGPVHFVGYHTGSMVAVEAALQKPGKVRSIVAISAPIFDDHEIAEYSASFEPVPIDEAGTRFSVNWQRVVENRGPGVTLAMLADSFAENLRAGDDYEWGHRAAFAYAGGFGERIAAVDKPILVVNPADDCFDATKRSADLLRQGSYLEFTQWGHGFLNAYPDDAARVILNFVQEHDKQ